MFQTLLRKRDFYSGGLMTLLGAGVTLDSSTYEVGSLTHMGPGMFPLMLGVVLINGSCVAFRDNRRAFFAALAISIGGLALVAAASRSVVFAHAA